MRLEIMQQIVKEFTALEVEGVLVDVQTANGYISLHAALSDINKEKLDGMPMHKAGELVWKVLTA